MEEYYFSRKRFREFPGTKDLTVDEMVRDGVVFSRYFLGEYLRHRVKECGKAIYGKKLWHKRKLDKSVLESEEILRKRNELLGVMVMVANWMTELGLDEGYSLEENVVPSKKIGSYRGIGCGPRNEETVLLTGKLEGTRGHFEVVKYLFRHASVVLGVEPESYYNWVSSFDPSSRATSFFEREVALSLWAHHPLVTKVTIIPEATHLSMEAADLFYTGFFDRTRATYACGTVGEPYLDDKLSRGVDLGRGEDDWRTIPRFKEMTTSDYLRFPDLFSRSGIKVES